MRCIISIKWMITFILLAMAATIWTAEPPAELKVQLTWGHESRQSTPFSMRILGENAEISNQQCIDLESGDGSRNDFWKTTAGDGDVDGIAFSVIYVPTTVVTNNKVHPFWTYYLEHSDVDTARSLRQDPAYHPDSRKITVQMNGDGTKGFSVTVDQLLSTKSFWIPSLDAYLSAGDQPVPYEEHRKELAPWKGKRILEQVRTKPEASYEEFTRRWEDMGSPNYLHPNQPVPGHIVCLSWDSAIPKFGVDRGGGVWNDYGNPDRFRFWYGFGDLNQGINDSWKGQYLEDGLPIVTTFLERDRLRYGVEQFAYPLNGPPTERRGDIPMVLLQKIRVTNLDRTARTAEVKINHQRILSSSDTPQLIYKQEGKVFHFLEDKDNRVLYSVAGDGIAIQSCQTKKNEKTSEKDFPFLYETEISFSLNSGDTRELVVTLPSPLVPAQDREKLLALKFSEARAETIRFWSDYLVRGAQFRVPEKVVNNLFRANLWHALRLPRRHGGSEEGVKIDLPYSNFAYDQTGIPWPVNQAVYVDYMLNDLRGYHDLSVEELLAMFRENQESNGHVRGFANWGVYTPSMLYAVAKNFLLSQDRDSFEQLLPYTLKALDWCSNEIQQANQRHNPTQGLIRAPLNDLTGDGIWAFTQAYIYAGLNELGKALRQIQHPRTEECLKAARQFRQSIQNAFGSASMKSPLAQLRDHTWIPYTPCEALTPQRLFEQWYPTDIDTGATHLIRLKALAADGELAESLLNDHEDNLYLYGWGMANEPVYNPQATAYLQRDDPQAVVNAFYSMMACAFSHSAFEPVEHRWFWGQYFGPPSTDGAWFELYRNMLIRERDDDTLILLQATPRKWLANGQQIAVENAPTEYGDISFTVNSRENATRLTAEIDTPDRSPKSLLLRLRHPDARTIQSVTVNNRYWRDFDIQKEWIVIQNPNQEHYSIVAKY